MYIWLLCWVFVGFCSISSNCLFTRKLQRAALILILIIFNDIYCKICIISSPSVTVIFNNKVYIYNWLLSNFSTTILYKFFCDTVCKESTFNFQFLCSFSLLFCCLLRFGTIVSLNSRHMNVAIYIFFRANAIHAQNMGSIPSSGEVLPSPRHQAGHPICRIRAVHHYYLLWGTCREINE